MGRRVVDIPRPRVAAIYARVSSERQSEEDKVSLPTQVAAARAWCAAQGWAVDEQRIYVEVHSGEDLWQRPVLMRMLEDARAGRFGLVLSHSVDRLSRGGPTHMAIIVDMLERAGVLFDFVTEQFQNDPVGMIVLQIRAMAATIENERRRERSMRAIRERANRGKLIPSNRPLYGYEWRDDAKEALIPDPVTARVVERIFREVAAGMTLRAIATRLTIEGIPTPTRRSDRWNPITVRKIVLHSTYWGQPVAFRSQSVPVEKHLREHYAHKMRRIERAQDEWVLLPADVAPALVSPALAEEAHRRLRLNQQYAARNNARPSESLLRGGIARCGYCGGALYVNHIPHHKTGYNPPRSRYICKNATRTRGQCSPHAMEAHVLDTAVWAQVAQILTTPALIEQEIERLRKDPIPGADVLMGIDARIREMERKASNLARTISQVDDDDAREALTTELTTLTQQKRTLEAERQAAAQHFASWQDARESLEQVQEWLTRVGRNVNAFTYEQKRDVLIKLRTQVRLYRADHTPRIEVELGLPLFPPMAAGTPVPTGLDGLNGGDCGSSSVVVFGHSHIPYAEDSGDLLLLNPGSATDRRTQPACTIALLTIEDGHPHAAILTI